MKILTWNIKHGGTKSKLNNIINNLVGYNADLIVLTEYREEKGQVIKDRLGNQGWTHHVSSSPMEKTNGILFLSKVPIVQLVPNYTLPQPKQRWLEVYVKEQDFTVLGIHIPGAGDKWGKEDFWKCVIQYAERKLSERVLIIGDFNTGLKIDAEGTPFKFKEYMERLIELGWTDSWRYFHLKRQEYTWYSSAQNGFRLDYAFLSPKLMSDFLSAYHSHEERVQKLSDHSSLVINLGL